VRPEEVCHKIAAQRIYYEKMRRLRRFFNRADPDRSELNILRGILSAAQKAARQGSNPLE